MPKVTVLISAFNVADYIGGCLSSLLAQTFRDIEIRVVDDGSTDATFDHIRRFNDPRIIASRQDNRGKAATLNDLLEQAEGEYVMIQDGDDACDPRRVELLLQPLESGENLGLVMSGHALIIGNKVVAPRARAMTTEQCRHAIDNFKMPAHDPTVMVRTAIARQLPFETSLAIGQGLDFILRAGELHDMKVVGASLYHYRVNPQSVTRRQPEQRARHLLEVFNRARQRRGMPPLSFEIFYAQNRAMLEDRDNNLSGHFTDSAFLSVMAGKRTEALGTAMLSLQYLTRGGHYGKPAVYALSPRWVANRIRTRLGRANANCPSA